MGAFDGELAALGYQSRESRTFKDVRKKVVPAIGMRVEYGYYKEGTVMYVSDSLVVSCGCKRTEGKV